MVKHDKLIFCILRAYPELVHGKDFWVGHDVDGDVQISTAYIMQWSAKGIEQPTVQELEALVAQYGDDYEVSELDRHARYKRDKLLQESDVLLLRAQEAGADTAALVAYRQALRDVPAQSGYPHQIDWPEAP